MRTVIELLAAVAVLANGVIYGTDVFAAVVQRAAMTSVDDAALTAAMGHGHRVADRRFPPIGITGLVAALAAAVAAAVHGAATAAAGSGLAVVMLLAWLAIFARVSAPVNRKLTAAAVEGRTPVDVRQLQATWDSVITTRVGLQTVALIGLCVTLATA